MPHSLIRIAAVWAMLCAPLTLEAQTSAPATRPASRPADLGACASLNGRGMFPPDNPWNRDVSKDPVDPNSDRIVAGIGAGRPLHPDFGRELTDGIPYVVVDARQAKVPVEFAYKDESDAGPYPVPPDAPIEGGPASKGDRHVLVLDRDNWVLYELYAAYPQDGAKRWKAGSGAIFDLKSNKLRPPGWTSADAAGLPILPGLVRHDEAGLRKEITHAVRFTVRKTRRAYVAPATHWASSSDDPNLPPMGMRVRLKASVDISKFPPQAKVILTALKKYGMILADNGGDWFITGSPHPQWDLADINSLKQIKGRDFEVVRMDKIVTR